MISSLFGLLLPASTLLIQVGGLQVTELMGPRYPDRGSTAKLSCLFDTENKNLNSVKWYKDDNEFYRYTPEGSPKSIRFDLKGVNLDESVSGKDHVVLTGLTFSSTGVYRCEVSTEAPDFAIRYINHNMTVLAHPQHNPRLEGLQEIYAIHDVVACNCTPAPSNPAPKIVWYINNLRADDYLVEYSPQVRLPDETFTSSAMLKFSAQPQHFLGATGVLTLRCAAEVEHLDTLSTTAVAQLQGALSNQKFKAHEDYSNTGLTATPHSELLLLLSIILLMAT